MDGGGAGRGAGRACLWLRGPDEGAEPVPQRVEGARLGYDYIVPVPASSRRRGYNVPERMAQPLAEALDLPLETKALGPARRKDRQAGLPFEQRLANVPVRSACRTRTS